LKKAGLIRDANLFRRGPTHESPTQMSLKEQNPRNTRAHGTRAFPGRKKTTKKRAQAGSCRGRFHHGTSWRSGVFHPPGPPCGQGFGGPAHGGHRLWRKHATGCGGPGGTFGTCSKKGGSGFQIGHLRSWEAGGLNFANLENFGKGRYHRRSCWTIRAGGPRGLSPPCFSASKGHEKKKTDRKTVIRRLRQNCAVKPFRGGFP